MVSILELSYIACGTTALPPRETDFHDETLIWADIDWLSFCGYYWDELFVFVVRPSREECGERGRY